MYRRCHCCEAARLAISVVSALQRRAARQMRSVLKTQRVRYVAFDWVFVRHVFTAVCCVFAAPASATSGYLTTPEFGDATLRTGQAVCVPGSYCQGGRRFLCPGGVFGYSYGLSSAACDQVCPAGFYCPGRLDEREYCARSHVVMWPLCWLRRGLRVTDRVWLKQCVLSDRLSSTASSDQRILHRWWCELDSEHIAADMPPRALLCCWCAHRLSWWYFPRLFWRHSGAGVHDLPTRVLLWFVGCCRWFVSCLWLHVCDSIWFGVYSSAVLIPKLVWFGSVLLS